MMLISSAAKSIPASEWNIQIDIIKEILYIRDYYVILMIIALSLPLVEKNGNLYWEEGISQR